MRIFRKISIFIRAERQYISFGSYLFASALLATIPVVILFMMIEKHLVAGLTSGGVKG